MSTDTQQTPAAEQAKKHTPSGIYFRPNVDIVELPDELRLVADMPGVKNDTIDVGFEEGVLTVEGLVAPRHEDRTKLGLSEYGVGNYYRTFRLGEQIDPRRIRAEYSNGVLTIHLPKAEEAKPRKIPVQASA